MALVTTEKCTVCGEAFNYVHNNKYEYVCDKCKTNKRQQEISKYQDVVEQAVAGQSAVRLQLIVETLQQLMIIKIGELEYWKAIAQVAKKKKNECL